MSAKQKSKNWTKRIFKPLLKSHALASSTSHSHNGHSGHQSDDGLWRTDSRDSFASATSNEGATHPLARRMTTESSRVSSAANGASGAPLTRTQSAGMGPGRSRKNTKMLNGRVYGSKSTAAAFQNIRDGEPDFIEWGHGGAGSVNNHSGGAESSKYASVQSGNRVSIGAVSGDHPGEVAGGEDDDDGSGLAWIRKRKAQRERERVEKEAKMLEDAKNPAATTDTNTPPDDTVSLTRPSPAFQFSLSRIFVINPFDCFEMLTLFVLFCDRSRLVLTLTPRVTNSSHLQQCRCPDLMT
jgi:hypothetical protein